MKKLLLLLTSVLVFSACAGGDAEFTDDCALPPDGVEPDVGCEPPVFFDENQELVEPEAVVPEY